MLKIKLPKYNILFNFKQSGTNLLNTPYMNNQMYLRACKCFLITLYCKKVRNTVAIANTTVNSLYPPVLLADDDSCTIICIPYVFSFTIS